MYLWKHASHIVGRDKTEHEEQRGIDQDNDEEET